MLEKKFAKIAKILGLQNFSIVYTVYCNGLLLSFL